MKYKCRCKLCIEINLKGSISGFEYFYGVCRRCFNTSTYCSAGMLHLYMCSNEIWTRNIALEKPIAILRHPE